MARQPRFRIAGIAQHVTQRGNNRQAVFFSEQDYLYYLKVLDETAEKEGCLIHAFVLMTNHIHLLVTPTTVDGISRMMQGLGRRYVSYINKLEKRSGTLWEGRYKASLVGDDRYLLACMRYIEMNPVRASMVKRPQAYRWSSYRANTNGEDVGVKISEHASFQSLVPWEEGVGRESREKYRQLVREQLTDGELGEIRTATKSGLVYGNDPFQEKIAQRLQRKVQLGKAGRPKKGQLDSTPN